MAVDILRTAIDQWFAHRSARLGAALAFYSVFSMGPLLLIVTSIAGAIYGVEAVRGRLAAEFASLLGETGAKAVEAMLAGASSGQSGMIAAVVGVVMLVVAALAVVTQLKDGLNTIWNVKAPRETSIWRYVRTYLVLLAGILALGFLLAMSLAVTAALAALGDRLGFSEGSAPQILNFAVSLAVLTVLFAMMFKWFPDTHVAWADVWPGALATALLFNGGKQLIGWYIGSQGLESTYGAAASIVVLLVWVYYSAQILLFGAELTHAYAHERGSRRREDITAPSPHSR